MLVELSIIPIGAKSHVSQEIANVLRIVENSGIPYRLTPTATCLEGEWNDIMALIHKCHKYVRRHQPHVITTITIEDEEGARSKLSENIRSVEEKIGHSLKK